MKSSEPLVLGRYDAAGFLSLSAYAASAVVIPVALVPIAQDLGFALSDGGMGAGGALQFGRSVFIVLSMILCGFAAGRWGKRRTMGVSLLFMGGGLLLGASAPVYGVLFLALAMAGFGEGFIEGLGTPLIQDLHPDQPGRYIHLTHAFWPLGVIFAVILSGFLLSGAFSWRLLLSIIGLVAFIPALLFLLPGKPAGQEHQETLVHWTRVGSQVKEILKIRRFWTYFFAMFLAGGGEFCLTYWSASYIRLNLGGSAWAGGIGTAFFSGGMLVARLSWGYLIRQDRLKHLIVFSALGGTVVSIFLPLVSGLPLFGVLLFLVGIATGPFWPSVQSHCTNRIPEVDTTMLFVLLSCAGIPGTGFFSWFLGFLGDRIGLQLSFFLVPLCFGLLGLLIWGDWLTEKKGNKTSPVPV